MRNLAYLVPAGLLAASVTVSGAPLKELMTSRYMRYQFCMEHALGQGYAQRLGIETWMNQWGVSEPTYASITRQPEKVRHLDEDCRKQNEIQSETRPDL